MDKLNERNAQMQEPEHSKSKVSSSAQKRTRAGVLLSTALDMLIVTKP